jgi:hypothetical protein
MKKLFYILYACLFLAAGCSKEEEIKLSEFIIGEWDSDLTALNPGTEDEIYVYFYASFDDDNTFDLDFLSFPEKTLLYSFEDLNYTINNEFNLTIDNPMEEGKTVDFDIVWNPDFDKMVWIPVYVMGENPPTIVFTRK